MSALLTPGAQLFAPDAMLPAQFYGRLQTANIPGEQRLRIAVMLRAWNDVLDYLPQPEERAKAYVRDALSWVKRDDPEHPLSFVSVCQALKLDPQAVRAQFDAIAGGKLDMPRQRISAHSGRGHRAGLGRIVPIQERRRARKAARYNFGNTPR